MKGNRRRPVVLAALACLALASAVLAQSSADYDIPWYVMGGGGGRASSDVGTLQGTLGQQAIGASASGGGNVILRAGYWAGIGTLHRCIYLPLLIRDD